MSTNKLFKKLATVRLEGPINLQKQNFILDIISKLDKHSLVAMVMIINSYGGSFTSALAISHALKQFRDKHQIPIYCFAEDFCLNSANLILTTGTKCYANKLSMIGDFGFVSEAINDEEVTQKYGIGKKLLSNQKIKVRSAPFYTLNIDDQSIRQNLIDKLGKQLIDGIIENRGININLNNNSRQEFEKNVINQSIIQPYEAVTFGLLDKVYNLNQLKKEERYKSVKVIEFGEQKYQNPYMNWISEFNKRFNPKKGYF